MNCLNHVPFQTLFYHFCDIFRVCSFPTLSFCTDKHLDYMYVGGEGGRGRGKGGWGIVFYKQISSSTGVYSVNVICTVRIHVAWLHAMSFIFLN